VGGKPQPAAVCVAGSGHGVTAPLLYEASSAVICDIIKPHTNRIASCKAKDWLRFCVMLKKCLI
jgi:hypothetical protein